MKNFTAGFSKIFILITLIFQIVPALFSQAHAEDFSFEYEISNSVTSDLKLITEYSVTVTNNIGKDYISKTQIIYPFNPQSLNAYNSSGKLNAASTKDIDGNYVITVDQKPLFGVGEKFSYKLNIITTEAIVKKGDIYDISVPGLIQTSNVKIKQNNLKISKNLPGIKYISKSPQNEENAKKLDESENSFLHYIFSDANPISIILGEKSQYSFTMTFQPQDSTIFFPPTSEKQKVAIEKVSNVPDDTLIDNDNNILLKYDNSVSSVQIQGNLEIQTDKYKKEEEDINTSLDKTYWKYDKRLDTIISESEKQPTNSLKIKSIIDGVGRIIRYNDNQKSAKRMPVEEIMNNLNSVHSINIADLVIAASRTANIPTKLVGGFVDTQVSKEFSNTGLHFWIEYYDPQFGGWKQADPTLQILSPADNYYDSIGLSHITVFTSRDGNNIPKLTSYSFQAKLENGSLQTSEAIKTVIKTKNIASGKDKSIEVESQNIGNTLSKVNNISTSIEGAVETTDIKKVIFPNQSIVMTAKIKNENYYQDSEIPVNIIVNTQFSSYDATTNIKFSQSHEVLLIVGVILLLIISILTSVYFITKKSSRNIRITLPNSLTKKR